MLNYRNWILRPWKRLCEILRVYWRSAGSIFLSRKYIVELKGRDLLCSRYFWTMWTTGSDVNRLEWNFNFYENNFGHWGNRQVFIDLIRDCSREKCDEKLIKMWSTNYWHICIVCSAYTCNFIVYLMSVWLFSGRVISNNNWTKRHQTNWKILKSQKANVDVHTLHYKSASVLYIVYRYMWEHTSKRLYDIVFLLLILDLGRCLMSCF